MSDSTRATLTLAEFICEFFVPDCRVGKAFSITLPFIAYAFENQDVILGENKASHPQQRRISMQAKSPLVHGTCNIDWKKIPPFRLRNRFTNDQQLRLLHKKLHKRRQDNKTKINEREAFKNSSL